MRTVSRGPETVFADATAVQPAISTTNVIAHAQPSGWSRSRLGRLIPGPPWVLTVLARRRAARLSSAINKLIPRSIRFLTNAPLLQPILLPGLRARRGGRAMDAFDHPRAYARPAPLRRPACQSPGNRAQPAHGQASAPRAGRAGPALDAAAARRLPRVRARIGGQRPRPCDARTLQMGRPAARRAPAGRHVSPRLGHVPAQLHGRPRSDVRDPRDLRIPH